MNEIEEKNKILFDFLHQGQEGNFQKYTNTVVDTQGTPYDYGSVMHYGRDAFSKTGQPTIVTLQAGVTIGQRNQLSPIDIQEMQKFYKCKSNSIS